MNRIFRADDGTEISELDVAWVSAERHWTETPSAEAARRLREALGPKTCRSTMRYPNVGRCILPPGHHGYRTKPGYESDVLCCDKPVRDPIHGGALHVCDPSQWSDGHPAWDPKRGGL